MSRKFSNRRKNIEPKKNPIVNKDKKTSVTIPKSSNAVDLSGGDRLFLIMSNNKNKKYNIDSTIETWLKNINNKDQHCFILESSIDKTNCFTTNVSEKYKKNHDSYSPNILIEFLKNESSKIRNFNSICFCTDSTYINAKLFESAYNHWGYVSALLPSSIETLNKIDNKISPEEIKMYHGEAGFSLSSDIVLELGKILSKNDKLVLDRWDSTIGYCLNKMGAIFNHDDNVHLFPHTILNHSSKEVQNSKSYGYLKFYDKKNIFDILK